MAVPGLICPGSVCALAVAWLFLGVGPVVPGRRRRSPFDLGRGGDLFWSLLPVGPDPGSPIGPVSVSLFALASQDRLQVALPARAGLPLALGMRFLL